MNAGYLRKTKIISFTVLALFFLLASRSCSFAWDTSYEMRRLNKEAPSLDGFKGAEALVWLKDSVFKMLNDGSLEHTKYQIVFMGENVPDEWKVKRLPVPVDGTLEIKEAAWYNPMTGLKEGNLSVTEETLSGGALCKVITTPPMAAGRSVVLITKECNEKRYGVDAAIPMAGSLPIWEQNVTVEIPEGRELYFKARDLKEPAVIKSKGLMTYKWTVMNQEPWDGEGFVVYKRPELIFSSRKGLEMSLDEMNKLASCADSVPIPAFALKGDKSKNGVKLMEWIAAPSRTLSDYPKNWVRTSEFIPKEGPWTRFEQTLILAKWLKTLGWNTELWWQSIIDVDSESPATQSLWNMPVLDASPSSAKNVMYQVGQAPSYGIVSPALSGTYVCMLKDNKVIKKKISDGSPSDNRLALYWQLAMNDNGVSFGKMTLNVSGGWAYLLSDGTLPQKENLVSFIKSRINFAIPGMELTPTAVVPTQVGYRLEFDVKCVPGLILENNLLLRLPGGIPARVGEMIGKNTEYAFRFPFTVEQKVKIDMPRGYKLLQAPVVKKVGEGTKAVLKESIIHWPKKAQLIAESTWVIKTTEVDARLASVLKEELAACLRWPVIDIPFRK